MPLTVSELVSRPALATRIVAGACGAAKRDRVGTRVRAARSVALGRRGRSADDHRARHPRRCGCPGRVRRAPRFRRGRRGRHRREHERAAAPPADVRRRRCARAAPHAHPLRDPVHRAGPGRLGRQQRGAPGPHRADRAGLRGAAAIQRGGLHAHCARRGARGRGRLRAVPRGPGDRAEPRPRQAGPRRRCRGGFAVDAPTGGRDRRGRLGGARPAVRRGRGSLPPRGGAGRHVRIGAAAGPGGHASPGGRRRAAPDPAVRRSRALTAGRARPHSPSCSTSAWAHPRHGQPWREPAWPRSTSCSPPAQRLRSTSTTCICSTTTSRTQRSRT